MKKITIIGSGSVGSTIAYTLTVANIATEIIMIDINGDKGFGLVHHDRAAGGEFHPALKMHVKGMFCFSDIQHMPIEAICQ